LNSRPALRGPFLVALFATASLLLSGSPAFSQLSLSLATQDRQLYSADTALYVPVQRGGTTFFVEASPRLTIPAEEIQAVLVNSRRLNGGPSYDVTFTLLPPGARRLAEFTAERVGQYVAVKFGDVSLGLPRIVAPITNGIIQGRFSGLAQDRAQDVFAKLGSKVTWK
jgi:preprotein translocase subunit SecD